MVYGWTPPSLSAPGEPVQVRRLVQPRRSLPSPVVDGSLTRNQANDIYRHRFTAAHELGHLVLLLAYVMTKLLTQVAQGSDGIPLSLARGVAEDDGVTLHLAPLPIRDRQAGAAQSSETIANDVATIGTAMVSGITACVVWPCAIPLRICRP